MTTRRTSFVFLGLAVVLAVALGLWAFEAERAAAHPIDMTVGVTSVPGETAMATGSIIQYTVTVTTDAAPSVNAPLNINLSGGEVAAGGATTTAGNISCTQPSVGATSISCNVLTSFSGTTGTVIFNGKLTAVTPAVMQVGAVLDPPIDGTGTLVGLVDEGTLTPDFAQDEGDDAGHICTAVGEGSDGGGDTEPDNFDCTEHSVGTVDLTVTKIASPVETTAVSTGGTITYTITVTNSGTGTATNVAVRDRFETPAEVSLTNVSFTPPDNCSSTTLPDINCTIASLAGGGASRTITVTAQVTAAAGNTILEGAYVDPGFVFTEVNDDADEPGTVPDCATVGEGAAGSAEPDNFDCTSHTVGTIDLTITKAASPVEGTVANGATITYTLTATNSGTGAATSVVIRDRPGTGLTFVSMNPASGSTGTGVTCSDTTGPDYDCTAASIPAGETRAATVVTTVSATSGSVLNGASVDPAGAIAETNEDADDATLDCATVGEGSDAGDATEPDNFDCTSHTLGAGLDLTLSKTASPTDGSTVATGSTITYTVSVSASGGTATSVAIRDTIGTGLSLTSVSPGSGVTCSDVAGPEINCTAASIASGSSVTVTVNTTVTATSGAVLNGARVDPASAITETNEDADDPALVCSSVGEGSDAGDATENDNFDCTSHTVGGAVAGTRTLTLSPAGWHNFVWTGATGTEPATALACISGNYQIAYEWVPSANTFHRFVEGHTELSTMLPLTQYDPLLVLITAANVTCTMAIAP